MIRKKLFIRLLAAGLAAGTALCPVAAYASEGSTAEETAAQKEDAGKKGSDKKTANEKSGAASTAEAAEETAPAEEPFTGPSSSMAEALEKQRTMVADDDIMLIRIGYLFSDGTFDEWERGTGFVVGNRYIITRQTLADTSTLNPVYQKILKVRGEDYYNRIGVNLGNEAEVQKHIACMIKDINGNDIVIHDITIQNGLALIVTKDVLGMPAVIFADPRKIDTTKGVIVNAKSAGNSDTKCAVSTFQGAVVTKEGQAESRSYFISPEGEAGNPIGAPVYDKNGHIIGMIAGDQAPFACFSTKSLETFLTMNGVSFRAIEQIMAESDVYDRETSDKDVEDAENSVTDKTALEAAIEKAQSVNPGDYTEATYSVLKEAVEKAVRVDANLAATQEEADAAAKEIEDAYAALESSGFFKSFIRSMNRHRDALMRLPIFIGLIAVIVILVRKYIGIDKEEKKAGKESALARLLRIRKKEAGAAKKEEDADEGVDITSRPNRAKRKPGDYDPGVEYAEEEEVPDFLDDDEDGSDDTVFLRKAAYLVRESNGKMISITKKKFIIGKERGKVDYCIVGNKNISRQHCVINILGDEYYIEDNDSANYTFLNGKRLKPYANAHIKDGDRLTLCNETFIFHKGQNVVEDYEGEYEDEDKPENEDIV